MRVAVVGGGIFGCTAAVDLARAGHGVDLVERHEGLMFGASRCNQGRLHYGYHYPRSQETARLTQASAPQFNARFADALDWSNLHYYAIAREGSHTGPAEYLAFLRNLDLEFNAEMPEAMDASQVALCINAPEALINLPRLRELLLDEMREAGVSLQLNSLAAGPELPGYDVVVDATYGRWSRRRLQREVCEIAIANLPAAFADLSLVILDGEFMSIDPLPGTDRHLVYHVKHSVHSVSVSTQANGEAWPMVSNFSGMVREAARFFPAIAEAQYRGSMYCVRAVLPDHEQTDARPTLVEREGHLISILSGKIDTVVGAAQQVVALAAG